jgi:hypothetical protein
MQLQILYPTDIYAILTQNILFNVETSFCRGRINKRKRGVVKQAASCSLFVKGKNVYSCNWYNL